MKPFTINVERISGGPGASLDVNLSWTPESLDLGRQGLSLLGSVDFKGSVSNIGGAYSVSGTFKAEYSASCDRCLEPFVRKVSMPLSRVFAEPESEIRLPGDDEVEPISGYEIDLGPHIREELILSMSIRLLCDEGCKGICPDCGTDLNKGECVCAQKH